MLLVAGVAAGLCLALLAAGRTGSAIEHGNPAEVLDALAQQADADRHAAHDREARFRLRQAVRREGFGKSYEGDFRPAEQFHLFEDGEYPEVVRRKYRVGRDARSCFVFAERRVVQKELTPRQGQTLLCHVAADFPADASSEAAVSFSLRALSRDGREDVLFSRQWTAGEAPERWETVAADLAHYADKPVTLRFEGGPLGGAGTGVCVISDPRLCGLAAAGGPNVLFVSVETLRRDHMSVCGCPRRTTPFLDELAGEAIVFDEAYSQCSWTRPSVATMLTGLYPSQHGARLTLDRLSDDLVLLPEVLRGRGYATAGFFTNEVLRHQAFNYDQGFDLFVDENERLIGEVKEDVLHWLDEASREPFFVFMHTYDPHDPYSAPDEFKDAFDAGYRGSLAKLDFLSEAKLRHAGRVSKRDVEYVKGRYDAEILYTDSVLREIVDGLKARGLWDNTLLVITGDHGEEFYEHGDWGHARDLYPEKIRVPLFVRLPGGAHGGAHVTGLAGTVDIMPTVLSALHVPGPDYLPGIDLLTALEAGNRTGRKYHLAEFWDEKLVNVDTAEYQVAAAYSSVISGRHQYILKSEAPGGFSEYLFDLADDPAAQRNLAQREPDLAASFARLLEQARQDVSARSAGMVPNSRPERVIPDAQTLEQLKALGYL